MRQNAYDTPHPRAPFCAGTQYSNILIKGKTCIDIFYLNLCPVHSASICITGGVRLCTVVVVFVVVVVVIVVPLLFKWRLTIMSSDNIS